MELTSAQKLLHKFEINQECSYIALYCAFQDTALFVKKFLKAGLQKTQARKWERRESQAILLLKYVTKMA
jgi:hypothetical protein